MKRETINDDELKEFILSQIHSRKYYPCDALVDIIRLRYDVSEEKINECLSALRKDGEIFESRIRELSQKVWKKYGLKDVNGGDEDE